MNLRELDDHLCKLRNRIASGARSLALITEQMIEQLEANRFSPEPKPIQLSPLNESNQHDLFAAIGEYNAFVDVRKQIVAEAKAR